MSHCIISAILFLALFFTHPVAMAGKNLIPDTASTQSGYAEVIELEQQLEGLRSSLRQDRFSSQDFYDQIVSPLELNQLLNEPYLRQWEVRNSELQRLRFLVMSRKQHFFMMSTHIAVQTLVGELTSENSALTVAEREDLTEKFQRIQQVFMKWADASDTLEEGIEAKKHKERLYSMDEYFVRVRTLLSELQMAPKLRKLVNPSASEAIVGLLNTGLSGSYLGLQVLARSSLHFLSLPAKLLLPEGITRKINQVFFRNFTPLTTKGGITTLFKGLSDIKGYQVTIEGREHLNQIPVNGIPGTKVVNFFLPTHRNEIVDVILISHLNLPHFLLFANPAAFAGNAVFSNLLASIPEFIPVGKYRGFPDLTPTEKLIQELKNGRSPNVINFPQGFVSQTGEILAINKEFVQKLLLPLLEEHFEVNLIPISSEVDSRFLSKSGSVDEMKVSWKIHRPILHSAVQVLVRKQLNDNVRYIDHFLSTLWYENTNQYQELGLDELMKRAEENLGLGSDPALARKIADQFALSPQD